MADTRESKLQQAGVYEGVKRIWECGRWSGGHFKLKLESDSRPFWKYFLHESHSRVRSSDCVMN